MSKGMAKLIEMQLAESYDLLTGYQWIDLAVDAGEVGSILPAGIDEVTKEEVSEVYVKGMQMVKAQNKEGKDTVAVKVPGRIARGNWKELMQRVNDARA